MLPLILLMTLPVWPQVKSSETYARTRAAEPIHPLPPESATLSVDVIRPQVQFTVVRSDTLQPVSGLGPEHFDLYIDGTRRSVLSVVQESVPIAVTILLDTSASMRRKDTSSSKIRRKIREATGIGKADDEPADELDRLTPALEAIAKFFREANPTDQFSFVTFADRPRIVSSFGATPEQISAKVKEVRARGNTALNDAIIVATKNIKTHLKTNTLPARKVLLVLSDGENNNSWHHQSTVVNHVLEGDVAVYAVGIVTEANLLRRLAATTGGTLLRIKDLNKIAAAVYELSEEMHSVYVMTTTEDNLDGKYRRIQVRLKTPHRKEANGTEYDLQIAWHQKGYYAERVTVARE